MLQRLLFFPLTFMLLSSYQIAICYADQGTPGKTHLLFESCNVNVCDQNSGTFHENEICKHQVCKDRLIFELAHLPKCDIGVLLLQIFAPYFVRILSDVTVFITSVYNYSPSSFSASLLRTIVLRI